MVVPPGVAADPEVIEAKVVFEFAIGLLDWPTAAGETSQGSHGGGRGQVAEVVLPLPVGERFLADQPAVAAALGRPPVSHPVLADVEKAGTGGELASDAEYARRAGVSVPTIKRAMADLARRGIVIRHGGRRTVVADSPAVISGTDFSFSGFARVLGQPLLTKVFEKSCRLPLASLEFD